MQFSLAALAAVLGTASAHINGISVPSTIKPGQPFDAIILSSNWIQSSYDVAIAFGYAPGKGFEGELGTVTNSFRLGAAQSNQLHNFNKTVTIPKDAPKGKAVVSATLFTLVGAVNGPVLTSWNVSVTLGDKTSKKYKSSL